MTAPGWQTLRERMTLNAADASTLANASSLRAAAPHSSTRVANTPSPQVDGVSDRPMVP